MRISNSYDMSKRFWTRGALFQWKYFFKALRRRPPSRVYRGNKTFEVWIHRNTLFVKNISFAFPKSHNLDNVFNIYKSLWSSGNIDLSKFVTYTISSLGNIDFQSFKPKVWILCLKTCFRWCGFHIPQRTFSFSTSIPVTWRVSDL